MLRATFRLVLLGALLAGAPACLAADCAYLRELSMRAASRPVAEIEALLAQGIPAEPPAECDVLHSPLEIAAEAGRADTVRVLLAHGASTRRATLWAASQHDDPLLLGVLIDATEPERRDEALSDGLDGAATQGHSRVIAELLARGADPARPGHFALAYAAAGGHGEALRLLASALPAADPRVLDAGIAGGDAPTVARALGAGGDPHRVDPGVGNALSKLAATSTAARSAGDSAIAQDLLARGVDPNVPHQGKLPLTLARERESSELAGVLERGGARTGTTASHKVSRAASLIKSAAIGLALLLGARM